MVKLKEIYGKYADLIHSDSYKRKLWVQVEINNKVLITSFIVVNTAKERKSFDNISDALDYYNSIE